MENEQADRDGTAEPVSRDQILRHVRGQGNIYFPVLQLITSRIGNLTRLIHTLLYVMTIHTCGAYNYSFYWNEGVLSSCISKMNLEIEELTGRCKPGGEYTPA